jgi:hypothetical protein
MSDAPPLQSFPLLDALMERRDEIERFLPDSSSACKRITLDDHAKATAGVECKKEASALDESPAAYKPIDAVMAAQRDLVDIVYELKQVVCVKG